MTRPDALQYVAHIVDDALSVDHTVADVGDGAVLVGWQCGFEPMFVAVIGSTLNTRGARDAVDPYNAEEIAVEYLDQIGWFSDGATVPDFVMIVK